MLRLVGEGGKGDNEGHLQFLLARPRQLSGETLLAAW